MVDLTELGKKAKNAAQTLSEISESAINDALKTAAQALKENAEEIKAANGKDIKKAKEKGLSPAFIDRLALTDAVINAMAEGLIKISELKSPVGETVYEYENKEQGIKVVKKKVPFGVVGIIFESRPNVAADAFGLSLKTQNAVILKGGSDALNSNFAIVRILRAALKKSGIDENAVSLIADSSRETAAAFMRLNKYVDLLIPRGGAGLIKAALETATVPIIETGTGNCHIFVDESANPDMAANVIFNAKTQRYSVCNACESLVIHEKIAEKVLPLIYNRLSEKNVEMRCDEQSFLILSGRKNVARATDEDFYTEYGDAVISVKIVKDLTEAINHINEHSTHHSESIITENALNAETFLNSIDSACVYHNASTRFSDGFVFGLGAEIGISTQKLHARGPMGLDALTTTKYIVKGNGAVRK